MTADEETTPERPVSASRVSTDAESDSNDEAESELTIDMDADLDGDSACQNNNVSEERKIQEYMSRKDTAVIFPEPVEPPAKESEDGKKGESRTGMLGWCIFAGWFAILNRRRRLGHRRRCHGEAPTGDALGSLPDESVLHPSSAPRPTLG